MLLRLDVHGYLHRGSHLAAESLALDTPTGSLDEVAALLGFEVTTCQEHGAHRDLLRVVTHPGKGDVVDGYTRATWGALCAEVSKLRVATLDGDVLPLATVVSRR